MLIDKVHNDRLDEYGFEEKIYEAQGDFSDVENDVRV